MSKLLIALLLALAFAALLGYSLHGARAPAAGAPGAVVAGEAVEAPYGRPAVLPPVRQRPPVILAWEPTAQSARMTPRQRELVRAIVAKATAQCARRMKAEIERWLEDGGLATGTLPDFRDRRSPAVRDLVAACSDAEKRTRSLLSEAQRARLSPAVEELRGLRQHHGSVSLPCPSPRAR